MSHITMLWRGRRQAMSPPQSPISASEMRSPTSMESHVSASQIDGIGKFATSSEHPSATSDVEYCHRETQTHGTHPLASEDRQKSSTLQPNTKTLKRRRGFSILSARSQPRVITMLACVSYLVYHILGADLGLRLIQSYTEPRLHRAEIQLQAAKIDSLVFEELLQNRLGHVVNTTLPRRYGEDYEHCIARALSMANTNFLGLDFTQIPEVRNTTMHWATETCGKLMYTPQLYSPKLSPIWKVASKYRQTLEQVLDLFRYKVTLFRSRIYASKPWIAARLVDKEINGNTTLMRPSVIDKSVEMPPGFALDCSELPPCHLIFSGPSRSATDRETLEKAVAKARRQVKKWSWSIDKILGINLTIMSQLLSLHSMLISCLLCSIMTVAIRSRHKKEPKLPLGIRLARLWSAVAHLEEDEQQIIGLTINILLYTLVRLQLKYLTSGFDLCLLPVGAGLCAFHASWIIVFFDWRPKGSQSIGAIYTSIKELYLIIHGYEVIQVTPRKRSFSVYESLTADLPTKPLSRIAARFISPLTPISEDLRQERKAMHADQPKKSFADFPPYIAYASESDSDYDSESDVRDASYVDLAGGITPRFSDDDSDWSSLDG